MELVVIKKGLPVIEFNKEQMLKEVNSNLKKYRGLVFTEESQLGEAKSIRANLNKVVKTIDDERKRIEKEISAPIDLFKDDIKEIINLIKEVNEGIDEQVKAFEVTKRLEKFELIKNYWNENNKISEITLERVFDNTWLNQSKGIEKVKLEVQEIISKIETEIETLKQFTEEKIEQAELEYEYKKSLDLSKTITDFKNKKKALEEAKLIEKNKLEQAEELKTVEAEQEIVVEQPKEVNEMFILRFEIKATREQIIALSEYLMQKSIDYKKI